MTLPVVPTLYGGNTHTSWSRSFDTPTSGFLAWMKNAGMMSTRDEAVWAHVEQIAGIFTHNDGTARSLEMMNRAINTYGMSPMIIADYGNPFYDGGERPYTDAGRKAYAKYCGWLAQQVKGMGGTVYMEIWNEWNLNTGQTTFSDPLLNNSAANYVAMAALAYPAIKAANPNIIVVGPCMGDDYTYATNAHDFPFLRAAIAAGGLNYCDVVSTHLYNADWGGGGKWGADEILDAMLYVQNSILRPATSGNGKPFVVTETGYTNGVGHTTGDPLTVSTDVKTEQILRMYLGAKTVNDLQGIWLYDLINDTADTTVRESMWGFLDTTLAETPAGTAAKALLPFLSSAVLVQDISSDQARCLRFKGNGDQNLIAVWCTWDPGNIANNWNANVNRNLHINGIFQSWNVFTQGSTRMASSFVSGTTNRLTINAHAYPTLVWVDAAATISSIY